MGSNIEYPYFSNTSRFGQGSSSPKEKKNHDFFLLEVQPLPIKQALKQKASWSQNVTTCADLPVILQVPQGTDGHGT